VTPAPTHAQVTFVDPQFVTETVAQLPAFTPVGLTFAPDGSLFISSDQNGQIYHVWYNA